MIVALILLIQGIGTDAIFEMLLALGTDVFQILYDYKVGWDAVSLQRLGDGEAVRVDTLVEYGLDLCECNLLEELHLLLHVLGDVLADLLHHLGVALYFALPEGELQLPVVEGHVLFLDHLPVGDDV